RAAASLTRVSSTIACTAKVNTGTHRQNCSAFTQSDSVSTTIALAAIIIRARIHFAGRQPRDRFLVRLPAPNLAQSLPYPCSSGFSAAILLSWVTLGPEAPLTVI